MSAADELQSAHREAMLRLYEAVAARQGLTWEAATGAERGRIAGEAVALCERWSSSEGARGLGPAQFPHGELVAEQYRIVLEIIDHESDRDAPG